MKVSPWDNGSKELCPRIQRSGHGRIRTEDQYGFRKGHNCADLLTVAVDDWLLARDKKLHTAVVFIDLKKAFDNVQHQLLLLKLQQYGIGGTVLAWFWNYLSQRTQNVVLNGYFCSFKGVPQGSVLGPLLFNLYVADLPEIAQENRVALPSFADDMSLYCSRTTELEACKDASSAFSVLHQAIQDIGLEINAEKNHFNDHQPASEIANSSTSSLLYLLQR